MLKNKKYGSPEKFVKVKNHTIQIILPDDFDADEVEVIILKREDDLILTDEMKAILNNRVNEDKTTYLSAKDSIEELKNKHGI